MGTKHGWTDAVKYYTQALEQNCNDNTLNATCFANRAVANLKLGVASAR